MCASVRCPTDSLPNTQSPKRRCGYYHTMATCQGMLSEGWKREKEGGVWQLDGVEVSVMGCFFNSYQCLLIHTSWVVEGQSCVYQSQCVVARWASLLVMACMMPNEHIQQLIHQHPCIHDDRTQRVHYPLWTCVCKMFCVFFSPYNLRLSFSLFSLTKYADKTLR